MDKSPFTPTWGRAGRIIYSTDRAPASGSTRKQAIPRHIRDIMRSHGVTRWEAEKRFAESRRTLDAATDADQVAALLQLQAHVRRVVRARETRAETRKNEAAARVAAYLQSIVE